VTHDPHPLETDRVLVGERDEVIDGGGDVVERPGPASAGSPIRRYSTFHTA
jgi:hypothetical protein